MFKKLTQKQEDVLKTIKYRNFLLKQLDSPKNNVSNDVLFRYLNNINKKLDEYKNDSEVKTFTKYNCRKLYYQILFQLFIKLIIVIFAVFTCINAISNLYVSITLIKNISTKQLYIIQNQANFNAMICTALIGVAIAYMVFKFDWTKIYRYKKYNNDAKLATALNEAGETK